MRSLVPGEGPEAGAIVAYVSGIVRSQPPRFLGCWLVLPVLLTLGSLPGVVYVTAVPPWGVPDEVRHFAYVRELWLESQGRPEAARQVEREVLASMERHRWFEVNRRARPEREPESFDDVPFLRLSNSPRGRQPAGYYWLGALALRSSGQTEIDAQLHVLRALGATLGTGVVALAYLAARTVLPGDRTVSLTVAAVTALVPQRAFIAAGVNNDNLAILAASLTFVATLWLLRTGATPLTLAGLAGGLALTLASKATALAVLPAVPVAVVALGLRATARRWGRRAAVVTAAAAGGLIALATLGLAATSLQACDTLQWGIAGEMPCTRVTASSPAGPYALRVVDDDPTTHETLQQPLAPAVVARLRGQTVTFGAWVRAPAAPQLGYLQLYDGRVWHTVPFAASGEWAWVSRTADLGRDVEALVVNLNATAGRPEDVGEVWYAGLVLVEGDLTAVGPPTWLDGSRRVAWRGTAGSPAHGVQANLVENAALTRPRLRVVGPLAGVAGRLGAELPLLAVSRLIDRETLRSVGASAYAESAALLVDSFWAYFGWMSLRLPDWVYVALRGATLLAVVGATLVCARGLATGGGQSRLASAGGVLALLVVATGFGMAFLRGVSPDGGSQGRYALPVVVPFALVLCVGLTGLGPGRWRPALLALLLLGLLALNLASLSLLAAQAALASPAR